MNFFSKLFRRKPLVLMVCTANVCRSPLAACTLRSELSRRGKRRLCRVGSAGTSVGAPGRLPDPRMKALARMRGVSFRGERAVQLTASMARRAALIVVMEADHRDAVQALLRGGEGSPPVRMLGEWLASHPQDGSRECEQHDRAEDVIDRDIGDPYYANAEAMEMVHDQIRAACKRLAAQLCSRESPIAS